MANRSRKNDEGGKGGSRPSLLKAMPPVEPHEAVRIDIQLRSAVSAVTDALHYLEKSTSIDLDVLSRKVDAVRAATQEVALKTSQGAQLNTRLLVLKYNALMGKMRSISPSETFPDIDESFFTARHNNDRQEKGADVELSVLSPEDEAFLREILSLPQDRIPQDRLISLARILVRLKKNPSIFSNRFFSQAQDLFTELMGELTPEKVLAEYDAYQKEVSQNDENPLQMSENNSIPRQTADRKSEISQTELAEIKKSLEFFVRRLSRKNLWQPSPDLGAGELSLYSLNSDSERARYLREEMRSFPFGKVAFDALLRQASNLATVNIPLQGCMKLLKDKTPEQIDFLLGSTAVEVEEEEDDMPSPVNVLDAPRNTAGADQEAGASVEVADVTAQGDRSADNKYDAEREPDVVRDTATEMKEEDIVELKKDLQEYIKVLSQKNIWKKIPRLLPGESSLHAFIYYKDRESYLRQQMRLLARNKNILSRLLAQAVNPHLTERHLLACKEILKDKTSEQVEFLLGPTIVKVEYDQDPLDSIDPFDGGNRNISGAVVEIEGPETLPRIEISINEPGVMPDPESTDPSERPTDVSESRRPQDSRASVLTRAKSWIKGRVDDVESSDFYRAQVKGEYLQRDFEKTSPPSYGVMIGAAVGSAAMSAFGVALVPDAIRYATQRIYSDRERKELNEKLKAIRVAEIAAESKRANSEKKEQVVERVQAMQARIQASRYLTPSQKDELLAKLGNVSAEHDGATRGPDEAAQREIGRILEHAIRPRISEEKVKKEALNTLLMVSGYHVLRAPAYGVVSLYERWKNLTREKPESPAGERFRSAITNGFSDWWDNARGNKGRLTQAAAFGTAARFVGMGGVLVESLGENSEYLSNLLKAWDVREPELALADSGIYEQSLDEIGSDTGSLDTGTDTGDSRSADDSDSGDSDTGAYDTGAYDTGTYDTGDSDSGSYDSGSYDMRDLDTGDSDSGSALREVRASPDVAPEENVSPAGTRSLDWSSRPDFKELFDKSTADIDSGDDRFNYGNEDSFDDEPAPDIALDPSRIPDEAIIRKGDGITHALLVAIEADPSLLKATDHVLFTDEQLSPLFLRRLAMQEGLLDYWINDKAIGNLAVVPLYKENEVLTIGFLNPETGERYTVQELKDLGWLTKAPRS